MSLPYLKVLYVPLRSQEKFLLLNPVSSPGPEPREFFGFVTFVSIFPAKKILFLIPFSETKNFDLIAVLLSCPVSDLQKPSSHSD
jgi:hypothetical protein